MQQTQPTVTEPPARSDQDYAARIRRAQRLLEERLSEDLPLAEVAAAAGLSPFHFHRLFRGLVGEPVAAHVRRLRLERAAHRLEQTDADILSIALDVGYGSNEAFTRAFARQFGVAPSTYRAEGASSGGGGDREGDGGGDDLPPIDVRLEPREPERVACVRHVGPYSDVASAWKTLFKWGWRHMIFGRPAMFALCHDDPEVTQPERCRYDACLVVKASARIAGPVSEIRLPGGNFAVVRHRGPYDGLGQTYAALFARVASGPIDGEWRRLGDPPSLERYLNDPRKTAPEDLETEVWMPLV
ncbi:AraC family transcriptional regulator [Engelhardtia mirabilis]|uniref:Transposon Tn10 TetD protein n=1 Tax=Engelhardtia mirabilis TaxID=2528011 RepID=A0A518BIB6_9BACT|nr:Transposon Tn10 TetD protein [Planctomycetes bacterium Pla133]QDV01044.1 Transposon Tn10 TetD protein [Planctomycetes bacterium Pla86]